MQLHAVDIRLASLFVAQQQVIEQTELIVGDLLVQEGPGQFLDSLGNDTVTTIR